MVEGRTSVPSWHSSGLNQNEIIESIAIPTQVRAEGQVLTWVLGSHSSSYWEQAGVRTEQKRDLWWDFPQGVKVGLLQWWQQL